MTDMITPELAHRVLDALEQSPHIGPDGSLSALFIVRDAVKAWEAESAREVEVLQLAKRLVQEEFGGYNQWHDLSTSEQERRIQYVKFILAFLAADGRLLPEGGVVSWPEFFAGRVPPAASFPDVGMVLTEGQWAMARILIEASHRKPEVQHAADRLRDEFKVGRCRCGGLIAEPSPGCEWHTARDATPPAVPSPDGAICGEPGPRGSACIEKRGHPGGHFAIENAPASGEPELCPSTHRYYTCTRELGHEGQHEANDGRIVARSWPAEPVPDSGPDGTPEKPWPTSRDVPDGVRYQGSTRYGDKSPVFVNRDGHRITEWQPGVEFANTHPDWAVERWAPFVRVDGDEA